MFRVLAFACALAVSIPARAEDAALAGLWKATVDNGPAVSGALTIARTQTGLSAEIGAYSVPVSQTGNELRFQLPDNQGRFRGQISGNVIHGFWIQPATPGLGTEFASPVGIKQDGDHWRGDVNPLADKLTIYLSVAAQPDGTLSAFLRNPELNIGRGHALLVTLHDDHVEFTNAATKQMVLRGRWDRASDSFLLAGRSSDLEFHRADQATAIGFNERTDASPLSYLPGNEDDCWKTGALSDAGINVSVLSALAERIAGTKAAPGNTPYIDSLLIARHGRLVFEEYFDGYGAETLHTLRSAGKTLTSVLLGAVADHGVPIPVNTPVYPLFPNYPALRNPDPRKAAMTIEHLLTMSSGLACDDDDENSPGQEDNMQVQNRERDWLRYTLELPMVRAPGEKAVYCSAGVNLVFGALANATHRWVPEMFDAYLARPLAIRRYAINLTPTGEAYGGGGIYLRPRDALKFGQVYLDGGVWNGRRIVSKAWVDASTTTHSKIHDDSTYGYNWWLYKLKVGDRSYDEFEAGGNGGQIIAVVPALDTVVAINAANYGRFDIWYKFQTDILPNAILPAMRTQ